MSYTLYDTADMWLYPEIRLFCEMRFRPKFVQDSYFVCSTHLSSSRIAAKVYDKIREVTGQEGQVIVIDNTQVASSGCYQE
ncbi:hypothetical protein NB640_10860 [Oxalobacter vibrioformis]|uniref:Uncharacterized protein n=1 Tax=Oxalobacter vibrioformis TaxID=933080 RepID=A0A9E9LYD1_9BURK|nr:hypothetical protein [Oxalobacter vibrioformis]WAW09714.1 hypothetical protein NB640_10860 [Oxalobacter vibrioformis]